MTDNIITINNLCKSYKTDSGEVAALSEINLTVRKGEILGIIGSSGAGKSTLVRCVNLLERPTSGQVLFEGTDIASLKRKELLKLRRSIGMIFQNFNLLSQRNVLKNVLFPLEIAGTAKSERVDTASRLLKEVGLSDKLKAYPSQLSGGQKQRVAIARALALNPQVLLCDEATSALDPETTAQILSLIKDFNSKYGLTTVVITHELGVIRRICDRVAVLDRGKITEIGAVKEVFTSPQSDAAKRLLAYEGGAL
ncbi:MAG: ATP-binding cassette domain-containing protein [Clostridia bacterium]|nr:ATP-binding cassette domain-containing protein [Clostridia bacterium]